MHAWSVMRANTLVLILITGCASVSSEKPFDQMTAQEHHAAAAREHDLADDAFARITGDDIVSPEVTPMDVYGSVGGSPYGDYVGELGDPETYTAWPRVTDPSEGDEDAASEHRENALRHESAAALLEGRPSPRPLPPPQEPLIELPPDRDRG